MIELVAAMNLSRGIENSLDSKLQNARQALEAANAGQRQDAVQKLEACVVEVEAQRGKALTDTEASQLVAFVNRVLAILRG